MTGTGTTLKAAIAAAATRIVEHADELSALDRAIGDGDHGINMKRGAEEVLSKLDDLAAGAPSAVLKDVGMALVMKIGGASGPLYGTLIMGLGKALPDDRLDAAALTGALASAIEAVKARGRSDVGQKTMLDVLVPAHAALAAGEIEPTALRQTVHDAAESTIAMKALKGRASFLGERSIGHMDPGARSSALMITALCDTLEADT